MLPSLFMRGVPPRAPRLKAPSTRTRVKSCAIIAALDEIFRAKGASVVERAGDSGGHKRFVLAVVNAQFFV